MAMFKSLHLRETVNVMAQVAVINNWLCEKKKKKGYQDKERQVIFESSSLSSNLLKCMIISVFTWILYWCYNKMFCFGAF